MPVANNTIRQVWYYIDTSNNPLTGMTSPADVTLTLKVDAGSGTATASETVSWVEKGSGFYDVVFTPLSSGFYTLFLQELNASSLSRLWIFPYEVSAAGAVFLPSYSNAFCAESDVERWLQQPISSTTSPSDTQTPAFAESRAAILMSVCAGRGYSVTPSTVTNGSRLQDLLREANAIGTAMDYTTAQSFGKAPYKTDRLPQLEALWDYYVGKDDGTKHTPGLIEKEIAMNLVSLATDYIISGDTVSSGQGQGTDLGIQLSMGDMF